MERLRQRGKKVAAAVATGAAIVALVPAGSAVGKITPVDTQCNNPAGKQPPGQQPTCTGGAHEQETENQNPAGHAPPGHNK